LCFAESTPFFNSLNDFFYVDLFNSVFVKQTLLLSGVPSLELRTELRFRVNLRLCQLETPVLFTVEFVKLLRLHANSEATVTCPVSEQSLACLLTLNPLAFETLSCLGFF
jgi:hypothetical protein